MDADTLCITELELAKRLGVSKETLVEIRTILLTPDVHWARKKSAVVYLQAGVDEVCDSVKTERFSLAGPVAAESVPVNPWTTAAGAGGDQGELQHGSTAKQDGGEPPADQGAARSSGADVAPAMLVGSRTVYVRRRARTNPRMIFVTEKRGGGEKEEFAVRVRAAKLFVPGQEIRITPSGHDGLPILHGPQPRYRGRIPGQRLRAAAAEERPAA